MFTLLHCHLSISLLTIFEFVIYHFWSFTHITWINWLSHQIWSNISINLYNTIPSSRNNRSKFKIGTVFEISCLFQSHCFAWSLPFVDHCLCSERVCVCWHCVRVWAAWVNIGNAVCMYASLGNRFSFECTQFGEVNKPIVLSMDKRLYL